MKILFAFLFYHFGLLMNLHAAEMAVENGAQLAPLSNLCSQAQALSELISSPFLFEIELNNKTSLLLGSVHGIKFEQFPNYAKERLLCARTLVLEMIENFRDMSKDELIKCGALRKADSDRWLDQIEEPLRTYLLVKLTPIIHHSHPDLSVDDLTPLTAYIKYDSPDNNDGMDYQLQHMFNPSCVFALESFNEAKTLFENDFDILLLKNTLAADYAAEQNGEETGTNYCRRWIDHNYCNGKLAELKDFFINNCCILDSNVPRNLSWLPEIELYHSIKPSPVLFVVGISHLLGKDGLLNLLQTKKNFAIRQLTPDGLFMPIDITKFI